MKKIVFLVTVDCVPDELADVVIDRTNSIIQVWNDKNDYGGVWWSECLDGDA